MEIVSQQIKDDGKEDTDMSEWGNLSHTELMRFIESAPMNLFFKDSQCRYQYVSKACDLVSGGEEHSLIGKTDLEIHSYPSLGQKYYENDLRILSTGKGSEFVSKLSLPSGPKYLRVKKNPVFFQGKIIGIAGIIRDVTKQVMQEQELKELSFRDRLTGLYNRNYMETRSRQYARSGDFPVSLIMADCNYLKRVNDTLGHEYGDLMLQRVARSIEDSIPQNFVAMRVGGDEFLILCPKCSADQAAELISRIRRRLKERSDGILPLDVALGSYTAQDDSLTFDQVFHRADRAMYENKKEMHRADVR